MKLSFRKDFLKNEIFRELGFESFLSLFEADFPILGEVVLDPMDEAEARGHYNRLILLDEKLTRHRVDLTEIVRVCRQLRNVDYLVPFFRDQKMETYHLFELGRFVNTSIELEALEKPFPLDRNLGCCQGIQAILREYLQSDFSRFLLSDTEQATLDKQNMLADRINNALLNLEAMVLKETGLRLIYSLPREMDNNDPALKRIKQCPYLKADREEGKTRLVIVADAVVKDLQDEQRRVQIEWERIIGAKVERLNKALQPFVESFSTYLVQRKRRILDYHFIQCKRMYRFCFPRLKLESEITLVKAALPVMEETRGAQYHPLDLSLPAGVNLLFGANLAGKSTVLKTVYFHLILIKTGLPLPAKQVEAAFPDQVAMLLKSSGQIATGSSGFTDELQFFSEIKDTFSVYLLDELFHSTDPVNGMKLTTAVLTGLRKSRGVFLLTSHYPEAVRIPGIRLLKMKDIDSSDDQLDPDPGLHQMPYSVEVVEADMEGETAGQTDQPLRLALRYSLPENIVRNIQHFLEE